MVLRKQPAKAGRGISTWLWEEATKAVLASQFWGKVDFRSWGKYLHTILQCDRLLNRNYDYFFVTAVNYFDKLLVISLLGWAFPRVTGCNNPRRGKTLRNLIFSVWGGKIMYRNLNPLTENLPLIKEIYLFSNPIFVNNVFLIMSWNLSCYNWNSYFSFFNTKYVNTYSRVVTLMYFCVFFFSKPVTPNFSQLFLVDYGFKDTAPIWDLLHFLGIPVLSELNPLLERLIWTT